uniref:Prolyl 4-hydroxylase alpha subunit Fe(2+) 2OG dioxygenase domain-containing protein n=1 Tax=viral metagenome TaxID=1070528 RepID=A0A6C0IY52_9ZZZZ
MFLSQKISIYDNPELKELKKLYNKLENYILNCNSEIHLNDGVSFNTRIGDITEEIKWIWAMTEISLRYFDNYLKSLNFYTTIEELIGNKFTIRGASFIVLDKLNVEDTQFHLDVIDTHQLFDLNTSILTLIFPLFVLEEGLGHLEYKDLLGEPCIYKYKKNELLVWDACKFEHRTQPFSVEKKYKRVLVSINLSTDDIMAKAALDNATISQGNILASRL